MYFFEKIMVIPMLPDRINRLNDFAYNLWWSWNPHTLQVFEKIDAELWAACNKNPVLFLQNVSTRKLNEAASNHDYLALYDRTIKEFDNYMQAEDTWYARNFPDKKDNIIAYFSSEYGLHETLPIYSGGLGVLSGDHCKSASDLGLPFVAVGLFYKQGYFTQQINFEGWQEARFIHHNVSELPIRPTTDQNGNEIIIAIPFPGRTVYAKVWEVHVGRIIIYMLDTDVPDNSPEDRTITSILYGGDQETRISQEIVLGIGGIKMLDALGITPSVYHLNEGHSAFCVLEIMRKLIQEEGLTFENAKEVVAASTIFTTHTPVPAGSDRFPLYLMDKYFSHYWGSLHISRHQFMELGVNALSDSPEVFNMTFFALKMSGQRNGVSKLHGMVSRNIFNSAWHEIPEEEVPITSITNGIHTKTWLSPPMKQLFDQAMGANWENHIPDTSMWEEIENISDEALWNAHMINKRKMIDYIRQRVRKQRIRNGSSTEDVEKTVDLLKCNALTIGFARRFATYKRATLFFRNLPRLQRILNNPAMPVQIIFAGKAHPADYPAQELIKRIHDLANSEEFKGKILLIENYDMELARYLVAGVDIWMNTPRRPLEASGTSGQKAALNGTINFSVLDGWWAEAYNGYNGWAIGDGNYYPDAEQQDYIDSISLYSTLEDQIIPLYFDRNENDVPVNWVKRMKASIKSCAPVFSTDRMVQEYTRQLYVNAMNKTGQMVKDHYALAKELSKWKMEVANQWHSVRIIPDRKLNYPFDYKVPAGKPIELCTNVYLGNIDPKNVRVEVYYGRIAPDGTIEEPKTAVMELQQVSGDNTCLYKGTIFIESGGEHGYTFRVIPYRPELIHEYDLGLIKWVDINESRH
ncbi:MAG: glycosyltransferase family 1 protein [Clostridiaceae bacterium]|nr:glycosyltransferase family 1 protein [Clostridiaceae bacterium]